MGGQGHSGEEPSPALTASCKASDFGVIGRIAAWRPPRSLLPPNSSLFGAGLAYIELGPVNPPGLVHPVRTRPTYYS